MKRFFSLMLMVVVLTNCHNNTDKNTEETAPLVPPPAVLNYSIVKIHPHDITYFTEGLFLEGNAMYESTGQNGESGVFKKEFPSGKLLQKVTLPKEYFGEGISIINNKLYELTWQQHKVFVYDMNFKKIQEFEWPFEGWGMTTDGKSLIIGTGGSNLYFVNPETFKIERTVGVQDNNGYVGFINELEYVDGYVYANIWQTFNIIKINLSNGHVEGKLNIGEDILAKTNQPNDGRTDVLNGIAYNSQTKSFYITGKYWPALYEIRIN